jgi:uncharacterized membrane protein
MNFKEAIKWSIIIVFIFLIAVLMLYLVFTAVPIFELDLVLFSLGIILFYFGVIKNKGIVHS